MADVGVMVFLMLAFGVAFIAVGVAAYVGY
jgi:hypothetical protein